VLPGQWRWTAEAPFPPLDRVLKASLWTLDDYKNLRWRLSQPAVDPTVTMGGSFATVELVVRGAAPGEPGLAVSSTQGPAEAPKGLLHVFPVAVTTGLPKEMAELPLAVLFVELDRQWDALPGWVRRCIATNVPVVLVGATWLVTDFTSSIRAEMLAERFFEYNISLHTPTSTVGEDYRYGVDTICILRKKPLEKEHQV
jgi:hypothetical protein